MTMRLRVAAISAGIALVLVTNALVLGHAWFNRRQGPDSTLHLSERELPLPYNWGPLKENSGTSLQIRYATPRGRGSSAFTDPYFAPWLEFGSGDAPWLDDAHLAALGFDVKRLRGAATEKRGGAPKAREVLFVLEFDGPAYAAAVERAQRRRDEQAATAAANPGKADLAARAKRAAEAAAYAEHEGSRLIVVDAGLNRDELRLKYPDRQRYAIVRGILEPVIGGPADAPAARIARLSVGEVTVPYAIRQPFERLAPIAPATPQAPRPNRFEATVSWGQLLEPWVESANVH